MSRSKPKSPPHRQMVGITDLTERYGVADDLIRRKIRSGHLQAYRVGRVLRCYLDEADEVFLVPVLANQLRSLTNPDEETDQ